MLFNILLFVTFAAIAYFHYTQGLFSSAVSAILCIFAAMLAIGYHEVLTPYLLKVADDADAIALLGVFLVAYLVSRLLFDNLVPGNIRFPVLMDRIGAAVFGLVAGLVASGILAVAAQSMPFSPSIGGYTRQSIADRGNIVVQAGGHAVDSSVVDELGGDYLGDPNQMQHLWLHQDEFVLGLARQLSDTGGSLSTGDPLESAHPDYVTELFGQRLGVPGGTRHLLVNPDKGGGARATSAYILPKAPSGQMVMDSEISSVRGEMTTPDLQPDMVLAVVRVSFTNPPGFLDTNQTILRLSPANVRLKAGANDYYPVGTMAGATLLLKNRPDDPLLIDMSKGAQTVDFLFEVSPDDLNIQTDNKEKTVHFKQGSFLEIARYATTDLSGKELSATPPETEVAAGAESGDTLGGVMRKTDILTEALKRLNVARAASSDQSQPRQSTPANNARQNNDLLPVLPNHMMGL